MSTFQEVVWDSTIPTVGSASLPHHHVFAEATSKSTESVLVMHFFLATGQSRQRKRTLELVLNCFCSLQFLSLP